MPDVHKWHYAVLPVSGCPASGGIIMDSPTISGNRLRASVDANVNSSLVNSRWTIASGSDFDGEVEWFIPSAGNPNLDNPASEAGGWIVALEARYLDDDDNRLRIYIQGHNTTYVEQAYVDGSLTQTAVGTVQTSGGFRITRSGNNWQAYYKNTGGSWSQIAGTSPIGKGEAEFRLYVQKLYQ
jgi:hypothetical protein